MILLRLPPLRERGEDILLLADRLPVPLRAKYGKDVSRIDGRARDLLLAYPWPGNVRELSHVIERAVLWSRGQTLDAEHLSLNTPIDGAGRSARLQLPGDAVPTAPPRGMDLEQWERSMIEQAMREAEGNQTRAAQRLGISRDTLRYRLKKFGIQWVITPKMGDITQRTRAKAAGRRILGARLMR